MRPVRTALRENVERGPEGPIGAQLQGATVDERAVRKYHLIPIAWRYTWDYKRQMARENGRLGGKAKRGAKEKQWEGMFQKGKG